ncbi:MAG: serine hydrolase [Thermodesulfobacteriota bacterium]|nr:serine hydrolase [Thermodesulfobacteriota bacterium]
MKRWFKFILISFALICIMAIAGAGWYISKAIPIGTGYAAKYLCSSVYISKRDPEIVFRDDIAPGHFLYSIIDADTRTENGLKVAVANSFGFFKSKAIYREGCGCTLVVGTTDDTLKNQTFMNSGPDKPSWKLPQNLPWPDGGRESMQPLPLGIDADKLKLAVDHAFAEPGPEKKRNTRAILAVYDGQLIAERYARGFDRKMPLLGWSMSKSVTNALVGILVTQGKLDLKHPAPVVEWQKPEDPRGKITLDMLLRMSSGLKFEETYAPFYAVTDMLFNSHDFAAFSADQPLESEPDTEWYYSSGTANIVARIVRRTAEKEYPNYYTFLRQELFEKIGMRSAIMEPDPSGTFVGSSYTFATPRDWARFGLLYLQDGVWKGKRILPEGWVKYTTTPTPKAAKGQYGALFWLNAGSASDPEDRRWPRLPRDTYCASGFQEQYVCVIPSKKLVAVRFGLSSERSAWDLEAFIDDVMAALPMS